MQNKTALITGAGRGIGRALALRLARGNYNLFLTARTPEGIEKVKSEASRANIHAFPANLELEESPRLIVGEAARVFGGIDVLINNAGIASARPVESLSAEEWDRFFLVNARAPFLLCREALPWLKKSPAGTIINISSVVGRKGYENQCAYTASKHALSGFTKALARETREDGIRVHLVSPGGVATGMAGKTRPDLKPEALMHPEDIARAVMFLISLRGSNAVCDEIRLRRESSVPWG